MTNQLTETEPSHVDRTVLTLDEELNAIDDGEQTDGRTMRRRRNRDAVIQSLIGLVNEGDLDPTVAKIADRAGVSHRSIFRYFDDLNDLAKTAVETEMISVWPQSLIADLGEGTLEHRITQFVDAQIRTFTRTHALGRVARAKMLAIPDLEVGIKTIVRERCEHARIQFATELSTMSEDEATAITTAITVLLSFESFDLQRRVMERSIAEVNDNWLVIMHRLLTTAA